MVQTSFPPSAQTQELAIHHFLQPALYAGYHVSPSEVGLHLNVLVCEAKLSTAADRSIWSAVYTPAQV